jgi:hypothetical protein
MRKFLAAVAFLALTACGSDNVTDPITGSIAGVYPLKTVNGSTLPYTLPGGTASNNTTVTADVITMNDNGTWSEVFSYRETVNGSTTNQSDTDGGTFFRSGANITLSSGGSTAYSGTFNGQSLLLASGGFTLVYTR